uniref:peptidyl-tRNA hydrolase n=1 Tax=Physcomitrium patens TaxID=3218 RepID=A0A2K1KIZ1_PHYPA|nr:hypothetical protein PHYPA_007413 [Physcomitrium patens]
MSLNFKHIIEVLKKVYWCQYSTDWSRVLGNVHSLELFAVVLIAYCKIYAAVGIYIELRSRNRALLEIWQHCREQKIVVICKNQKGMHELRGKADGAGLPTYTIADADRTQTFLVIGPGLKTSVDAITRHLRMYSRFDFLCALHFEFDSSISNLAPLGERVTGDLSSSHSTL